MCVEVQGDALSRELEKFKIYADPAVWNNLSKSKQAQIRKQVADVRKWDAELKKKHDILIGKWALIVFPKQPGERFDEPSEEIPDEMPRGDAPNPAIASPAPDS